jgi:SAM-dependent methyltransferase
MDSVAIHSHSELIGPGPILREWTVTGLHEALIDRIKRVSGLSAETPTLDIGCGTGAWLDRLASNGFKQLHGVDRKVGKFASSRATFSHADIDLDPDLGLGNRAFGLITAIEVVEHLENPGRLFFHVARHLSDDGVFLLTTPNIHSILCRFRFLLTGTLKEFDSKGDPTHIYPVLLTSLNRLLPRYGLNIADQFSYPANGKSIAARPMLKAAASALSLVLPNIVSGDILCVMIRRIR